MPSIRLTGDIAHIMEGTRAQAADLNLTLAEDGFPVAVTTRKGPLEVLTEAESGAIFCGSRTEFFRGLTMLAARFDERPFRVRETPSLDLLGAMLDCSRNAVPTMAAAKTFLRRLSRMGYNAVLLYAEDTYEVAGRPYFGYLRGRFSQAELRELDQYADALGIEMIPCIQTLGHMARALRWPCMEDVRDTDDVLLLDEPLGALDLKLRKDMQKELKAIQKRLGITFIYVTHDQEEALSMSDTVVVMDKGKIQQIGTPEDIYNEPVNAFVADFIGESNIVDAVMVRDYVVRFGGVTFDCLDSGFAPNEFVEAVVRPEDIQLCDPGHKAALTGTITDVVFKGVFFEIFVDVGGFIWMVQTTHYHAAGNTVGMYIEPDAIHIMKRSEYSGEFGDYSTFSDEMDHISDADYNWEEESNEQSGS